MKREVEKFAVGCVDIAIIGGGIHGSVLALAAARAGYSVALVEQGDWGEATSANSLKIVHGGIRYLQHGDFKRMRESIRSRRDMMRFAPHLVRPLACVMPTYGHGIKGRETMRLAFRIYDWIAADRNRGLQPDSRLPDTTALSPQEMRYVVPQIKTEGLTGGAVWFDAIAENSERLVLEYVKEAQRYGALVANYLRADELVVENGQVRGVMLTDRLSGRAVQLQCRAVVNSSGPWLNRLAGEVAQPPQRWAVAVNIVVKRRLFRKYAVGLEGYTGFTDKDALIKRGKRLFFFVPWRDHYTMIGTNYTPYHGDPARFVLDRSYVEAMVADVNKIYPQAELTMDDVGFCHGGLVPMLPDRQADKPATTQRDSARSDGDTVQLDKSSEIIDHAATGGVRGLVSIKGVKYTTAPDIGDKVVALLRSRYLGDRQQGCYVNNECATHDFNRAATLLGDSYAPVCTLLKRRYGSDWRKVFACIRPEEYQAGTLLDLLGGPFITDSGEAGLLPAEIRYCIASEMACRLSDIVFRRTHLGSGECPGDAALKAIQTIMAAELGLCADEGQRQLDEVMARYAVLQEQ